MMKGFFRLAMAAVLGARSASAGPLVGPWPVEDPTEVVVLGSPHLSGIEAVRPEWLEPLLDRLAAWGPRVITIEALSGPQCRLLRDYDKNWTGTADSYCKRIETLAGLGAKATGLDMPAAEAAAEAAVAKMSAGSAPGDRRRLAALFAAAGNAGSAATQWLRLAPAERRSGDGVDAELAAALDQLAAMRNENYLVAAALAARLGLERVHPVDDHLSDRLMHEGPDGLGEALQAIWSGTRPPLVEQGQAMEKAIDGPAALLAYYRFLNRPGVAEAYVRADQGKAFATPSQGKHGRRYVAWWEARNLHMAANIRAALGRQPGTRALVIVGSTHKPHLEAYLGLMHELRLTPAARLLGK